MENELIERVALAITRERRIIGGPLAIMMTPEYEARLARAAVEAMRELPKGVILAMETAVEDSIDSTTDTNCTYDIWDATTIANAVHRAMIDEVLSPAKQPA